VLSTLRYFRRNTTRTSATSAAGRSLQDLVGYAINAECTGDALCVKACPTGRSRGAKNLQ